MKVFLTLAVAFTMVVSALFGAEFASADEKKMSPEEQQMMKKWMEYATPGEGHKVLEQFVGDWDYTVKWWAAPGTDPEVSTGESDVEWKLDGRFIEAEVEGTSMGEKFKGIGYVGYDNAKKAYVNVWMDNMGTGMMTATGQYDAATKTMTDKGSYTDPMTGQETSFRGVTKFIDKDNYTYELYTVGPDGSEFRMMEITYVREKS